MAPTPFSFPLSCLTPVLYPAWTLMLSADNHVGSRLLAAAASTGSMSVGAVAGGAVVRLVGLSIAHVAIPRGAGPFPPSAHTALLCCLAVAALPLLAANRAALGPPHPPHLWMGGFVSSLSFGVAVLAGQLMSNLGAVWRQAVLSLVLVAVVGGVVAALTSLLVLPSLAADELRADTVALLRGLGTAASRFGSRALQHAARPPPPAAQGPTDAACPPLHPANGASDLAHAAAFVAAGLAPSSPPPSCGSPLAAAPPPRPLTEPQPEQPVRPLRTAAPAWRLPSISEFQPFASAQDLSAPGLPGPCSGGGSDAQSAGGGSGIATSALEFAAGAAAPALYGNGAAVARPGPRGADAEPPSAETAALEASGGGGGGMAGNGGGSGGGGLQRRQTVGHVAAPAAPCPDPEPSSSDLSGAAAATSQHDGPDSPAMSYDHVSARAMPYEFVEHLEEGDPDDDDAFLQMLAEASEPPARRRHPRHQIRNGRHHHHRNLSTASTASIELMPVFFLHPPGPAICTTAPPPAADTAAVAVPDAAAHGSGGGMAAVAWAPVSALRPLLARARACAAAARLEPPWLISGPTDLDAWSRVLACCETLIKRVSALESLMEGRGQALCDARLATLLGWDLMHPYRLAYAHVAAACAAMSHAVGAAADVRAAPRAGKEGESCGGGGGGLFSRCRGGGCACAGSRGASGRRSQPLAVAPAFPAVGGWGACREALRGALRSVMVGYWARLRQRDDEGAATEEVGPAAAAAAAMAAVAAAVAGDAPAGGVRPLRRVASAPAIEGVAEPIHILGSTQARSLMFLWVVTDGVVAASDELEAAVRALLVPAGEGEGDAAERGSGAGAGGAGAAAGTGAGTARGGAAQQPPSPAAPQRPAGHPQQLQLQQQPEAAAAAHGSRLEVARVSARRAGGLLFRWSRSWVWAWHVLEIGMGWSFLSASAFSIVATLRLALLRGSPGRTHLLSSRTFHFALKYWLICSTTLVLLLGLDVRPDMGFLRRHSGMFVYIAGCLAMTERVESTLSRASLRVAGTLAGCVVGLAVLLVPGVVDEAGAVLPIVATFTFLVGLLHAHKLRVAIVLALVSLQAVTLCQYHSGCCGQPSGAAVVFAVRVLSVTLGCVLAVVVSRGVLPWYTSDWALETMAGALEGSALLALVAAPLVAVQSSLMRDTALWSRGLLATPRVVTSCLRGCLRLADRLAALQLVVEDTPLAPPPQAQQQGEGEAHGLVPESGGWAFAAVVLPLHAEIEAVLDALDSLVAATTALMGRARRSGGGPCQPPHTPTPPPPTSPATKPGRPLHGGRWAEMLRCWRAPGQQAQSQSFAKLPGGGAAPVAEVVVAKAAAAGPFAAASGAGDVEMAIPGATWGGSGRVGASEEGEAVRLAVRELHMRRILVRRRLRSIRHAFHSAVLAASPLHLPYMVQPDGAVRVYAMIHALAMTLDKVSAVARTVLSYSLLPPDEP
ncbi:hypothetical protein TSOC_011641 [Tetrabaena socialis]|uniref:Integral membrane bound transporter domain-containing protein n=1 Tax=Tetrabaena socialis TaxID=47790 RepID=A0A2J7ZQ44_9CHLO|nr:hypothetical protein TSOC_011641 [Tetrabaena socialis]|eukprot:PNH02387.1 hypothetical protein TSOC_011641 [Tetrabaena socialis]